VGPRWKETGDLVTWDMERTEVLNSFASVFAGRCSNHTTQVTEVISGSGNVILLLLPGNTALRMLLQ